MWIPDVDGNRRDILATTAEYLRVWEYIDETNSYKEHKILRNVSKLKNNLITQIFLDKFGLLRSDHFIRLEYVLANYDRNILDRYHLHHLGHRASKY